MFTFIKKVLLFSAPLIALLAFPFIILLESGEFYPLPVISASSRGTQPVVIGHAYSNFGPELHVREVVERSPEVVALGNSHVGSFRSLFFKDPQSFFNTSGAAGTLSDYISLTERMSDHPPKLILANMEHNMFNPDNVKNDAVRETNPYQKKSTLYDPFFESLFRNGGWWRVYADYFSGKFTLQNVFAPAAQSPVTIGLRARASGSGFTNDGSDYWGEVLHSPENQQKILPAIHEVASTIATNTKFNQYSGGISSDALTELRAFLSLNKARGTTVIGFFPPIAHEIYAALREQYGQTENFKKLGSVLSAVYAEYGFDFYDFSDVTTFGSSDAEMVEVQHGGEKMYLRLFLKMAEGSSSLTSRVDVPYLKERLAQATSTYYVFGIDGN